MKSTVTYNNTVIQNTVIDSILFVTVFLHWQYFCKIPSLPKKYRHSHIWPHFATKGACCDTQQEKYRHQLFPWLTYTTAAKILSQYNKYRICDRIYFILSPKMLSHNHRPNLANDSTFRAEWHYKIAVTSIRVVLVLLFFSSGPLAHSCVVTAALNSEENTRKYTQTNPMHMQAG